MDKLLALMRQLPAFEVVLNKFGRRYMPMLTDVVTAQMVSGVLNEIVGLLPVMIPAAISYIALRKGLGFVFSTLKKA